KTPCSERSCLGSVMALPQRTAVRVSEDVLEQAKDFLNQYFTSIRRQNTPAHEARWEQVKKEVTETGTYQLTETELIYGAKLAWRNASRCIGRIQWSKLQVSAKKYQNLFRMHSPTENRQYVITPGINWWPFRN
uniref:nitric-oxide synthase (NADPH) n=1 Tax=Diabrotica virgifera virgifera TaxID=50390 RepID=A0A6P7GPM8_DIAVI